MNEQLIELIVERVKNQIESSNMVKLEASGRHVHLSQVDVESLFGKGYQLKKTKDLSQPGQYVCEERVTLIGPKGVLKNVVVLGPVRAESQVEVSQTDANVLGKKIPIRESGNLIETPSIIIASDQAAITLGHGLIIAKSHIHMTPHDAQRMKLQHGDIVSVEVKSSRSVVFSDVIVRVNNDYATFMHIDYDEANACGFTKGLKGRIIHGETYE